MTSGKKMLMSYEIRYINKNLKFPLTHIISLEGSSDTKMRVIKQIRDSNRYNEEFKSSQKVIE